MSTLRTVTSQVMDLDDWLRVATEEARIDRLGELLEAEGWVEDRRRVARERVARWRGKRGRVEVEKERKAEEVHGEGRRAAERGRAALDEWADGLEASELARVTLRQFREWRAVADRVDAERVRGVGDG